jgi:type VI secretion system protein ImpM
MQPAAVVPQVGGFYGKLPTRGDFVRRGLTREFLEPLHQALALALADPAAPLDPLWRAAAGGALRFVLGSGCAGPTAWCGVMVPSQDQVCRAFPLTLALSLPQVAGAGDLLERGGLLDHLADLAQRAVAGGVEPDALQGALEPVLATAEQPQSGALRLLDADGATPALLLTGCAPLAAALSVALEGGHGFWWRPAEGSRPPACLVTAGLPTPIALAGLLGFAP